MNTRADGFATASTQPTTLFQGYDTFSDSGNGTAVTGTSSSTGGKSVCYYRLCQTTTDVAEALYIHGELSATATFGSVNAKADYVHDLKLTANSVVVAVYANSVAATSTFTDSPT